MTSFQTGDKSELATRRESRRWVRPEDLNLAPELLGQALAGPWRRAAAMALDVGLIAVLTALANAWVFMAVIGLGLGQVRAHRSGRPMPHWVWAVALALCVPGFWPSRHESDEGLVPAATAAASGVTSAAPQPSPAVVLVVATPATKASTLPNKASAPAWAWQRGRAQIAAWTEEYGEGYVWALVYFSLLPSWWRGQTLGKRLLGLRVVELTGKPMTLMLGLKRYGGYAAGMATGGLGFAQVLWDPNRQALHDKAAHTVVLDLRLPPQPRLPDQTGAAPTASSSSESTAPVEASERMAVAQRQLA